MRYKIRKIHFAVCFGICLALLLVGAGSRRLGQSVGPVCVRRQSPAAGQIRYQQRVECAANLRRSSMSLVVSDKGGLANVFIWVRSPKSES